MQRLKCLFILFVLLLVFGSDLQSQNKKDILRIDNLMMQLPDSSARSTEEIAGYIRTNFKSLSDRTYAIFSWITGNIRYDVDNMFSIDFYQPSDNVVNNVLKSRTGVCLHYADLYKDIADKSGIKTYVILGYTRQKGLTDHIPHAWCASLIDTTWYLIDPAWGSGYFENGNFHKQRNLKYYKIPPSRFIKTHIPFDPIWQFLNYPVTNFDFYNYETSTDKSGTFFNYADSINKYDGKSELEKMESSIYRIKHNGITNVLIYRELKYLNDQIMVKKYNHALTLYNESVSQLNEAIRIWNEFNPEKNTEKISELLDSAEYSGTLCRNNLSLIKNPSEYIRITLNQLDTLLEIAENSIIDLKSAVLRYKNSREKPPVH